MPQHADTDVPNRPPATLQERLPFIINTNKIEQVTRTDKTQCIEDDISGRLKCSNQPSSCVSNVSPFSFTCPRSPPQSVHKISDSALQRELLNITGNEPVRELKVQTQKYRTGLLNVRDTKAKPEMQTMPGEKKVTKYLKSKVRENISQLQTELIIVLQSLSHNGCDI